MKQIYDNTDTSIYALEDRGKLKRFILSTPETRSICNDPLVFGMEYTNKMQNAMARALAYLPENLDVKEEQGMVFTILRGGLNFGLREALFHGKKWKNHRTAFISAQRVFDEKEGWHVTENRYEKVYLPSEADIYLGDVVATGVSLEYALRKMIALAEEQKVSFKRITFFTIGGDRAEELMEQIDLECRAKFPNYEESRIVYIEGIFALPEQRSPLKIALLGTDLLRWPAVLAPEFLASQAEKASYALERCTIYDAGSRAFNVPEYLEDVKDYWEQVKALAQQGMTYDAYLKERMPEGAPSFSGDSAFLEQIANGIIEEL